MNKTKRIEFINENIKDIQITKGDILGLIAVFTKFTFLIYTFFTNIATLVVVTMNTIGEISPNTASVAFNLIIFNFFRNRCTILIILAIEFHKSEYSLLSYYNEQVNSTIN